MESTVSQEKMISTSRSVCMANMSQWNEVSVLTVSTHLAWLNPNVSVVTIGTKHLWFSCQSSALRFGHRRSLHHCRYLARTWLSNSPCWKKTHIRFALVIRWTFRHHLTWQSPLPHSWPEPEAHWQRRSTLDAISSEWNRRFWDVGRQNLLGLFGIKSTC